MKQKHQENTLSSFCVANYCWALGLPRSVVVTPSDIPLETTEFPLASRY